MNRFYTKCILLFLVLSIQLHAFAQKGTLAGKVIDKNSTEEIIGATIVIEGSSVGTSSDIDGRFNLKLEPGSYDVIVSYVSYMSRRYQGVEIKAGEVTNLNVALEESSQELEEVVVKGEVKKESTVGLLVEQKNAVAVSSGVSAELIRRMPDRTTADVIKRVSGATIQDGKFAIIRGMQDRYNYGMINGAPLPSSEPDRKAFSLDLVPAQVIDNMVIVKTATPDMTGDFAGGIIKVNTRDIPDDNIRFINIGAGYNTLTTFKEFARNEKRSGTEFFGFDGGGRRLPSQVPPTEVAKDLNALNPEDRPIIDNLTKSMDNNFGPSRISALPNLSMQAGLSQRTKVFNNDFGLIAAITYFNNNSLDPMERNTIALGAGDRYVPNDSTPGQYYKQTRYRNNVNLGGILNFSYKIGQYNKFYFKNLITQVGNEETTLRQGHFVEQAGFIQARKDAAFYYQSNRTLLNQFGGEHFLPTSKLKIDYVIGATNIFMEVPDFKRIYTASATVEPTRRLADSSYNAVSVIDGLNAGGSPSAPGRYFYKLNENGLSGNVSISIPAEIIRTTFKTGLMLQSRNRTFNGRIFTFDVNRNDPNFNIANLERNINNPLDTNLGASKIYLQEYTQGSDRYTATSRLRAGFIMGETKILPSLRAIYGARVESYNQKIVSEAQGNPVNKDTTWVDFLPSVNIIYALTEKINLRASYSKTLSRPEFREFAPLAFYDFTRNAIFEGNQNLNRSQIHNFDLRFEYYPSPGIFFSITPFYKQFIDPVEQVTEANANLVRLRYENGSNANNYGVELEFRSDLGLLANLSGKDVFKRIVLFGNYTYIYSRVDQSNLNVSSDVRIRPLVGQSPYVLNFGAQYNTENDFNITISANQFGRRIIFITGAEARYLIWENPRLVMDWSISKTFKKKFNAKFTISDLLSQDLILYYNVLNNNRFDENGDAVFERYKRPTVFSLSIGYNF